MTQEDINLLQNHHNALCYIRDDLEAGEIVHEETSVEPHVHLLFASTQTWRDTLKMLVKTVGRPGVMS